MIFFYIPIYYLYAKIWGPKKCLLWDYPRSWWKAIDVKRKRKKYSAAAWPEFGTFLVIVHYCWFRRTCTDHCNQLIFLFSSLLPSSVPVRDKYFAKKAKLSRRSIFLGAELCITIPNYSDTLKCLSLFFSYFLFKVFRKNNHLTL